MESKDKKKSQQKELTISDKRESYEELVKKTNEGLDLFLEFLEVNDISHRVAISIMASVITTFLKDVENPSSFYELMYDMSVAFENHRKKKGLPI